MFHLHGQVVPMKTSTYKIIRRELPRRKHATFRTRGKFEIKCSLHVLYTCMYIYRDISANEDNSFRNYIR